MLFTLQTRFSLLSGLMLLSCLVSLSGCGGGGGAVEGRSKVYPVEGKVMYLDQPVEGATVMFHSVTENVAARGLTDAQGNFRLQTYTTNDGAVAGQHKVTVKKTELKTVPNPEDENLGPISSEEIWHTPKPYALPDTSPITETVQESGDNKFTIVLEG